MQPTTIDAIKAMLRADPTVTPSERITMLAFLKEHGRTGQSRTAGKTVSRIIHRAEVAQRLGCSTRTVDTLARQGVIRRVRLPGRKNGCGFLASDIDRLLDANRDVSETVIGR